MVSDDMLSQDEIDALLRGDDSENTDEDKEKGLNAYPPVEDYLSIMEQDALGEIGNISFGSSATALSTLLNQKVDITTPSVSIVNKSNLEDEFPQPHVAVQVEYTEGFLGTNLLVIKETDASIIADLMLGGDGTSPASSLGEIELSAVQEAMNQMMGSAATSMSTIFKRKVDISPPSIDKLNVPTGEGTDKLPDDDVIVKVSFNIKVGSLIDSSIMQLIPIEFAKELVSLLMNPQEEKGPELMDTSSQQPAATAEQPAAAAENVANMPQQQAAPQMQPAQQQMPYQQQGQMYQQMPYQQAPVQHSSGNYQQYNQAPPANIQPAAFSSFDEAPLQSHEINNLNMLLDIPLNVTVELGRTNRSVQEILELSSGSIVELDKLAGEPVDILVNNKKIAKGEVVVIDENFGVRVTDIISQSERMKKLQ